MAHSLFHLGYPELILSSYLKVLTLCIGSEHYTWPGSGVVRPQSASGARPIPPFVSFGIPLINTFIQGESINSVYKLVNSTLDLGRA